jgi:pilus assembly protein CpaE
MAQALARPIPEEDHIVVSVVDSNETVRTILTEHIRKLDFDAVACEDLQGLMKVADSTTPIVVIFGPTEPPEEVIENLNGLLAFRTGVGAIMIVHELNADVLKQALRAGLDDVVPASADDGELRDAVSRTIARLVRQPEQQPEAPASRGAAPATQGRVITVCGTKGGTGKSVVAINVAVSLAKRTIQPVVLVDADLQFGDVALMLQLQPVHTIAEAVQAGERLDGTLLERLLLRHSPSGLFVLAAPTEPGSADLVGSEELTRIVTVLREHCAYVVIDTPANFSNATLGAINVADDVLVLAGLDVMSLKSARVGLETLRVMGVPLSKVKFVLNRANTKVGLTERDAQRAVQLEIDAALPSDIVVAESVNRGVPVVMSTPRSRFARVIDDLAKRLMVPETSSEAPADT